MDDVHVSVTDDQGNPIQPLGWQGAGPDFEVYGPESAEGDGKWYWQAYDEDMFVGEGRHKTRFMAAWAMRQFKKNYV